MLSWKPPTHNETRSLLLLFLFYIIIIIFFFFFFFFFFSSQKIIHFFFPFSFVCAIAAAVSILYLVQHLLLK